MPTPRRWSRPSGWPRISADPQVRVLDASFKQPGIAPTARADYDARPHPGAVFFDIDDVAAARHQPAAHDPLGRTVRRRRWRSAASATMTGSSSTTPTACRRPGGRGGCCACSGTTTSPCSMAGCRNGRRRAGRSKPRAFHPAAPVHRPLRSGTGARQGGDPRQYRVPSRAGRRCPRRRPLRRHAPRRPGPAGGAATSPAAATCRSTRSPTRRHTSLRSADELRRLFARRRGRPRPAGRHRAAARG